MEKRYDPLSARNPGPLTGAGNNTWLLDGAVPTLVDAGVGKAEHLDAIAERLGGRTLRQVLVTHGHPDHASGAPALRARWPGVAIHKWPLPGERDWLPLEDNQRLAAGDVELVVIHTPGHAPDHVCFWEPRTRALYCGDMLVLGSTVMIPAGRGGRLRDYLSSLERMKRLDPAVGIPGHGTIIDQPVALIEQYIRHRQERDAQVRACLQDGVTDVNAMVDRIYPDLAPALKPAAALTVQAHLEMIRDEPAL